MTLFRSLTFLGMIPLVLGCMTVPSVSNLSEPQNEAVCSMANNIGWFGTVSSETGNMKEGELNSIAKLNDFSLLPTRITCEGNRVILKRRNGAFFDSFWLSEDGRQAAIAGGWVAAELLGGNGICYFDKLDSAWVRRGCISTGSI